jgi:hypothetical protein
MLADDHQSFGKSHPQRRADGMVPPDTLADKGWEGCAL